MSSYNDVLSCGEKIGLSLRSLYRRYGYTQYKMNKFEEYDLYARNKEFLISDNVITFTDLNGKLMALKPDVTLSIVHSSRDVDDTVQKVYYAENVYRVAKGSHSFKEIMQAGLECIGRIDDYSISEVVMLAAESLRSISENCVLSVSHLGIVSDALDALDVSAECRQKLLKCIGEKNLHELSALCEAVSTPPEKVEKLRRLVLTSGTPDEVLPKLEALGFAPAAAQLRTLTENMRVYGLSSLLRFDFSVVNDMDYYNGIVFKGFISGIPVGVLSGGQYDKLMKKMGRGSGAIGFAVYLDLLERLSDSGKQYDVDILLLYGEDTDTGSLCRAVQKLTEAGFSVAAQKCVPDKLKYKQLARLNGNEVEIIEFLS